MNRVKVWFKKHILGESIEDAVFEILGGRGFLGSKSCYSWDHPDHVVVFNAAVTLGNSTKEIWKGDIDLTLDSHKIVKLAQRLGTEVKVNYENEITVLSAKKDGTIVFSESLYFYLDESNIPRVKAEFAETNVLEYNPTEGTFVDKNAVKKTSIRIPLIRKLVGNKKEGSPWNQFQIKFVEMHGQKKALQLYPKLYLSYDDYNKLAKANFKWGLKEFKHMHPAKIEQAISMEDFQLSCGQLSKDCKWAINGSGYVRK